MQIISLLHPMVDGRGLAVWRSLAWRGFAFWREQRQARAALAQMTARDLADIGITPCDRTMVLAKWGATIPASVGCHDFHTEAD